MRVLLIGLLSFFACGQAWAQTCILKAGVEFCDNGSTGIRVGNERIWTDVNSPKRPGIAFFHGDGTATFHSGNVSIFSDNTLVTRSENAVVFSSGKMCMRYANAMICN
jgi:hypothetical protein